jgi:protein-tyrosine-phosphatase
VIDVVFVCTGNRFRSALAAAVLADAAPAHAVRTESYGTLDVGSAPALAEAVEEAKRFAIDLTGHRARPLAGADLSHADLVVGFERRHGVAAVVEANARRERTFTLPELVETLEQLMVAPRPDVVQRAERALALLDSRARPAHERWRPAEIDDPLGRAPDLQREIADRVHELTTRLAHGLFGQSRR